jgi:hypothetical protein
MSNLTVRQGNDLIEASYKIASLGEARLIRLLIAQISPSDEDFKTYQISVIDFARVFNLNSQDGRLFELLDNAAKALVSRLITIKNGKSWLHMNWLSSAEYKEGSGYVELSFDKKLKPYLLGLKSYFTQYDLEHTVHFKSLYSVRLFEILQKESFKSNEKGYFKRSFEYEELREKMGIEKDEYLFFKDFRIRVIETAQKEINKFSSLNIAQIDYAKTGRKITHIVFHIEKKKQTTLALEGGSPNLIEMPSEEKKEHPEDVLEMISMGIDEATAYRWRKKHGVKKIARNIAYTRAMQKAKKIKTSVSGYLARAIADDLASGWENEQQERDNRIKAEKQEELRKSQEEGEKAEKIKARLQIAVERFFALPEEKQSEIMNEYLSKAMPAMKKTFAKNGNEDRFFRDYLLRYFVDIQDKSNE